MARPRTGDKNAQIAAATIAEVIEVGLSAFNINRVAKRADLSTGTIYRYFDNKDALLASVYVTIKREVHGVVMSAAQQEGSTKDRLSAVWWALFDYASCHHTAFEFTEVLAGEVQLNDNDSAALANMVAELRAILSDAIADGTLCEAPVSALMTMFAAPLQQHVRRLHLADTENCPKDAQAIFEMTWKAIAAN